MPNAPCTSFSRFQNHWIVMGRLHPSPSRCLLANSDSCTGSYSRSLIMYCSNALRNASFRWSFLLLPVFASLIVSDSFTDFVYGSYTSPSRSLSISPTRLPVLNANIINVKLRTPNDFWLVPLSWVRKYSSILFVRLKYLPRECLPACVRAHAAVFTGIYGSQYIVRNSVLHSYLDRELIAEHMLLTGRHLTLCCRR